MTTKIDLDLMFTVGDRVRILAGDEYKGLAHREGEVREILDGMVRVQIPEMLDSRLLPFIYLAQVKEGGAR
jgi:hypothetical protein